MEQITAFVLGITVGLVAIMLASSYTGMLKIRKQIKQLQDTSQDHNDGFDHIHRIIDERFNDTHRSIEKTWVEINEELKTINRDLSSLIEELNRELHNKIVEEAQDLNSLRHKDFNDLRGRLDDVNRYIDSRIDKAIDGLCTRMDTMFIQKETDTTILKS